MMKKAIIPAVLFSVFVFAGCGGGNSAEADANKLCDCYKEGMKDVTKMGDCQKIEDEMKEKYKKGTPEYETIDKIMEKCIDEVKGEVDGD